MQIVNCLIISVFGWPDPNTWKSCESSETRAKHEAKASYFKALYSYFLISVFGWPDPSGLDQSEHALYTCYFIICLLFFTHMILGKQSKLLFMRNTVVRMEKFISI